MGFELWYVPLIAMVVVVIPPSVVGLRAWLRTQSTLPVSSVGGAVMSEETSKAKPKKREFRRLQVLAVMTVVLIIVFFLAIGPAAASLIATAATAVSAVVSAVLTVQSFLALYGVNETQKNSTAGPPSPETGEQASPEAKV